MKLKIVFLSTFFFLFLFSSCKNDDDADSPDLDAQLEDILSSLSTNGAADFILPTSTDFASIPQDPQNPITQEKVDLGQMLYHETGLAVDPMHPEAEGTYSCSSCHFASAGFQANRHQAISDGGEGFANNGNGREPSPVYDLSELDVQPIRTPSAMNGAYQMVNLWNGQFGATGPNVGTEAQWTVDTPKETNNLGYEGLETQAIAGLKVHRMENVDDFNESFYKAEFDAAFSNIDVSERYSREFAGLAIAAYERTLLSNQAPFQLWLNGNRDAMNDQEKEGAILFFGTANCASCHSGPALNSMEFHALGMSDLHSNIEATYGDVDADANKGRGGFTKVASDEYKFKVPQLYNLADSPFYGHGGTFRNIRDVIAYKNAGIKENSNVPDSQLADDFRPLNLTDTEIDAITAFLSSALHDPNLLRYQPNSVKSGNCFPVNDDLSKIDLGCD